MSQSKGSSGDGGGGGDDWCTIESDPGVFTEMLETLQVKGVELSELYSLDDDSLSRLGKVYGLIFLFQWIGSQQQEHAANKEPLSEGDIPEDLFFAHQVTTNACATQAILSVLFNAADLQQVNTEAAVASAAVDDSETTSLGSILSEFQSFTQSFPPALKGVAISSSEDIKKIHNSFSRQDAFLQEGKMHIPTGDEEAFHFVAYVPSHGTVYELDGLQKGPIVVGSVNEQQQEEEAKSDSANIDDHSNNKDQAWLSVARTAIQERMTAGGDEIKFNLMAIVQDKRIPLQQSLKSLSKESPEAMALQQQLAEETAKREQWKVENQRRRHNYVPLCIQLFRELAKQGSLSQLVTEAKERCEAKRQAQKAAKASGGAS